MKPVDIIVVVIAFTLFIIIHVNTKVLANKNKDIKHKHAEGKVQMNKLNREHKQLNSKTKNKLHNKKQHKDKAGSTMKRVQKRCQLSSQMAEAKKKCWDLSHMKQIEHRIINGAKAKRGTLPWVVSIYLQANKQVNRSEHICGGAIISTKFVLTAAHCLLLRYLPEHFSVHYGMHDRSSRAYLVQHVEKILRHPEFFTPDPEKSNSDIALMKLKETIKYNNFVHPICVPYLTTPCMWDELEKGNEVVICGWGHTIISANGTSRIATHLQKGYAQLVNQNVCETEFTDQYYNQSTTYCVGKRSNDSMLCSGDSGGPVIPLYLMPRNESMVFPVIIGIVSFGNTYCYGPDVLTKVESYIDWINKWTTHL